MKLGIGGIPGALVAAGLSCGAAFADIRENPYQSIVVRNPFALRPMPPSKTLEIVPTPVAPLSEIKLLGITTLLSTSKALFQYEDWQTKKIEFPSPLSEGETYKTFTVLAIDVENQRVRLRNGDTLATLDFVKDGVKPAVKTVAQIPARVPPPGLPNPGPTNDPNSRVVVTGGGPPTSSSPVRPVVSAGMTRDEAEALIEIARRKFQMQEQAGQTQPGQPASQILPPTRVGDALKEPFASPSP